MPDSQQANYKVNIALHVLILFTFLTTFFFVFISHVERKSVSSQLASTIGDQTDNFMSKLASYDPPYNIDWSALNAGAKKLQNDSQGELKKVTQNNKELLYKGLALIGVVFIILLSGLYVWRCESTEFTRLTCMMRHRMIMCSGGIVGGRQEKQTSAKYSETARFAADISNSQHTSHDSAQHG